VGTASPQSPEKYKVFTVNTFWSITFDAILLLSSVLPAITNISQVVERSLKVPHSCVQ
jgi:hypothetical protein